MHIRIFSRASPDLPTHPFPHRPYLYVFYVTHFKLRWNLLRIINHIMA